MGCLQATNKTIALVAEISHSVGSDSARMEASCMIQQKIVQDDMVLMKYFISPYATNMMSSTALIDLWKACYM